MMSIKTPRRMWALIGAAGTVAIVALGWVLLISGEKSRKTDLENQIASAQLQTATDQHKIALLEADNKKLPQYKRKLADLRAALPLDAATAQFAADITKLSNTYHVQVTSTSFAPAAATTPTTAVPADAGDSSSTSGSADDSSSTDSSSGTSSTTTTGTAPAATTSQLGVTISATANTLPELRAFLHAIQHSEPRALIVTQATENAPLSSGDSAAAAPTLSLTMQAFIGTA